MNATTDDANPVSPAKGSILCVDDEPNILSALQRLFRSSGYQVQVASNGIAAIELLQTNAIDVVISDMRMPEMDGAQFLQQVRSRWPATVRIMLTGQADTKSIMSAVNQGEISRYVTKPWDDAEFLQIVGEALERRAREREKNELVEAARRRNEELKALNNGLAQNTGPVSQEELAAVNARLKTNLVVTLKVFSILIESRHGRLVGHSRRVADLARRLATRLGLEPALVQEVFIAALLHDLGKLAFSDELFATPVANMGPRLLADFRQYAARGEQLLMPLQDLRGAAASIGAQLERFDGAGFPNQLKGRAILVGARILSVCSDYDNLQIGVLAPRNLTAVGARAVIAGSRGTRYDPWVLDAFIGLLSGDASVEGDGGGVTAANTADPFEVLMSSSALIEGMILSRDLVAPSGLMMLSASHPLDSRVIDKILQFEKTTATALSVYVKTEPKDG